MMEEPSYIDYEAFLDPEFSPYSFANGLILSTNNPSDSPLDLSTPLSRVLFDVQEIDTHIHTLTTKSAIPLLTHTKLRSEASTRILEEVEAQTKAVTEGYKRLEKEVIQRHEAVDEVRRVTERLWQTVKIGRAVGRCLTLGRQLEAQMTEVGGSSSGTSKREDPRAMIRASNTVVALRQLFDADGPGQEGEFLHKVHVIRTLRNDLVVPAEQIIRSRAQQIIREFSFSSFSTSSALNSSDSSSAPPSTYAQTEASKVRTTSACLTLYILSPPPSPSSSSASSSTTAAAALQPSLLLLSSLRSYLQACLTSSAATISRALTSLPSLDRSLLEVSARCQNIVALEALLDSIRPPPHPSLQSTAEISASANLLTPLVQALETSSLVSYFWRSLAGLLASKVQEIMTKGGVQARNMRAGKEGIREGIRTCVIRGSKVPEGVGLKVRQTSDGKGWEREVAVMVGAVVGSLGR